MNQLTVIEHNNQRVLTTQQLAEAYGTDAKAISKNFNNNAHRYVQGKHYYLLEGEELRAFRKIYELPENLNRLYLWPEKGAWLHAKSLGTDKAWEAYEMLVDDYFVKHEITQAILNDPIMMMRYEQIQMEQRLAHVENGTDEALVQSATANEKAELANKRLDELDAIDPDGTPRQQLVKLIRRYSEKNGLSYDSGWNKFRESYNIAFHTNIQTLRKNHMRKNGIKKMTMPEFLEATNRVEDALRVANKMLNPIQAISVV